MKFSRIILDGDIWLHRAVVHATTRTQFDDVDHWHVDVRTAGGWMRQQFAQLKDRLGASRMLIALGDRHQNFRKELSASYKAHRAKMPRPPGFLDLEQKLRAHAKVVSAPRLEGDDLLGILMTQPQTAEGSVCVTIDKDALQIPGWHYNPDKDELQEVTPEAGALRHLHQTLTGDRVDGYPGCPGVGPVKAAKILAGDPETVWERVVEAFEKVEPQLDDDAGTPELTRRAERTALLQARLAWVLRAGDYDKRTKEIKLWTPE